MEQQPRPEQEPPREGSRLWVVLTFLIGVLVLAGTLRTGRDRNGLATSDEAAYAEQADSLLDDGSLTVGFVRHYHVQYPAGIDHPEDFYPPGNGGLLALSRGLLGRTDFASMVPSALLACLLLPLLTFFLARAIGVCPPFALVTALAVMFDAEVRELSIQGLADLPFVAFFLLAILIVLRRAGIPGVLLAGASLAASYYFKPTAILFAPGLFLAHWIVARPGLRRLSLHGLLMAVAFLAVSGPWLVRNACLFDDPLYSGNKHLSATASDPHFEYNDIRKVYWADPEFELPSMGGTISRYGWRPVITRFLLHLYEAFVSKGAGVFSFWFLLGMLVLFRRPSVLAIIVVVFSFALALSAVFAVETRYLLPCVPLCLAVVFLLAQRTVAALDPARFVAGTGLEWLAPLSRRLGRMNGAALLVGAIWLYPGLAATGREAAFGVGSFAPGNETIRKSALWVDRNLPEDVRVMHQQALRFHYYSRRRTVEFPFDGPDEIQAVVAHHRIGCIVFDPAASYAIRTRKFLDAYLERYGDLWRLEKPEGLEIEVYRLRDGPESGPR
ncbi:MAG: glycosyltransferase family 39 protein [Planctomycetota bacterium]